MRKAQKAPLRSISIQNYTRRYVQLLLIPMVIILFFSVFSLLYYTRLYTGQLNNVTTASSFNQSFKESVDLKMYYYVTGSRYSDGLPLQEVEDARTLAKELMQTTTLRESRSAISNVLDLCDNLESKILETSQTESYDEQQRQLDSNIYVLTSLIQEYMYNYLYYESVELNQSYTGIRQQINAVIMLVLAGSILTLAMVIYYAVKYGNSLAIPLSAMSRRVHEIGEGELTVQEPVPAGITELQTLSNGFEEMVRQLREQQDARQRAAEQLRQTEFSLLQAQINPHFLYNTLDTIIWLEECGQTERSIEMVTNLSSYFRTSLSNGRDIITLEEELTHVHSYLDIQQVRYQDILEYHIDSSPELSGVTIPKLTLQPLVENALYHGVKLKRGKSRITITCRRVGNAVRIEVADNGAGMSEERLAELRDNLEGKQRTGFGFIAVHERLRLLFGAPYGLMVDSIQKQGTIVTVLIPFDREEAEI